MRLLADHIITPIGSGATQVLDALREARTGKYLRDDLTLDERLIRATQVALQKTHVDATASSTLFILSTTKGESLNLITPARRWAQAFLNTNTPIVVSNACTSGVCAQVVAERMLLTYQHVIVAGADRLTSFIESGFGALHALASDGCRPFDNARDGIELGEAVAVMVLGRDEEKDAPWRMVAGSVHNDANHITGPSRTGEGSMRCLRDVLSASKGETPACISLHGTGTLYNDEMEAQAIHRAGLQDVPVLGLKGYFGHTLGAAGVLETLVTMYALERGYIPATKGFKHLGTSLPLLVSSAEREISKQAFIKLLSGFGGVNAAVYWRRDDKIDTSPSAMMPEPIEVAHIELDASTSLTSLYRERVGDYPKYFKMDLMARAVFIAGELLLQQEGEERFLPREDRAVVIATRSASLMTDRQYEATMGDTPSPALFVYTLPNVPTGEVAIRNHYMGETMCYVLPDETALMPLIRATLRGKTTSVLGGWVEVRSKDDYQVKMSIWKN